jgi:ADP-ribosylation factor-like protein 13B
MQLSEETKVSIYDVGGGVKIRGIWEQYYADCHGVVYVFDSADGEKWEESLQLFKNSQAHKRVSGKPTLVLANKQASAGAKSVEEVESGCGASGLANCKVLGCDADPSKQATDANIETGLEWLFGTVTEQYTGLSKRVEGELAEYHEEKKQAAFARKMRVMKQLVQRAFVPEEGEKSECLDHDEGMKFIADELGMVVSEMPAAAVAVGKACGFQRMALQMIGDLKSPISKKNKARSWEEILEILNGLRKELQIADDAVACGWDVVAPAAEKPAAAAQ